jgi:hypothetical protein
VTRDEIIKQLEENDRVMRKAQAEKAIAADRLEFCESAEFFLECERVHLEGELEKVKP